MIMTTLGASLQGNMPADKGFIQAGEETNRKGQNFECCLVP